MKPDITLRDIADYSRCSVRNKASLSAYAMMGAGAIGCAAGDRLEHYVAAGASIFYGAILLMIANYAIGTYRVYRKTLRHIQRHGCVDARHERISTDAYCKTQGYRMALEESGLEYRINTSTQPRFGEISEVTTTK
jgi:hypothetical protein